MSQARQIIEAESAKDFLRRLVPRRNCLVQAQIPSIAKTVYLERIGAPYLGIMNWTLYPQEALVLTQDQAEEFIAELDQAEIERLSIKVVRK